MLPYIEENVPELLCQRTNIAFCANLHLGRGHGRTVSSLVLGRNLKFYEFRNKELLHHIDLQQSQLKQLTDKLQSYDGPMSSFLRREDEAGGKANNPNASLPTVDHSMLQAAEDLPLGIGKFVWLQEQLYVLVHCWQLLLVLRRPPEHGANFELVAQHDHVAGFRMVNGPIKHQAYVELRFTNGKRQRTDFQPGESSHSSSRTSSSADSLPNQHFERLLQKVHTARAELCSQRAQTQQDFARMVELQTFGPPGHRSLLLEEKQLLRRFGDVWTRICGDYLVCGTLLANIAGSNRLSIVHSLRPLLHLDNGGGDSLSYEHRLYELPVQPNGQPPEDYDALAQFWSCQDQHSRRLNWRPVAQASQLLPDCTAVLLVRLRLEDLLQAEQLQLLAIYEIRNGIADSATSTRQMHLASIDVVALLQQPEALAPRFAPATLHQDFLAVIMTQTAHCALRLDFIDGQAAQDCARFEQLLVAKLQFELITDQGTQQASAERGSDVDMLDAFYDTPTATTTIQQQQRIFYNSQPLSQWCGVLLLRDDPGQHWHVYARTQARLRLLLHRLMRDLLQLHCNLSVLELSAYNAAPADVAGAFEACLREELLAWTQLLKPTEQQKDRLKQLTNLHQLQMASDVLATVIRRTKQEEE